MSKTASSARGRCLGGCGPCKGRGLAAAIDRLNRRRRGLSSQTEKHVARPVCTREQQQRPASLGSRTEHRTSAAHTCTAHTLCTHTRTCAHMQGFTFAQHERPRKCSRGVVYQLERPNPLNGNMFFRAGRTSPLRQLYTLWHNKHILFFLHKYSRIL